MTGDEVRAFLHGGDPAFVGAPDAGRFGSLLSPATRIDKCECRRTSPLNPRGQGELDGVALVVCAVGNAHDPDGDWLDEGSTFGEPASLGDEESVGGAESSGDGDPVGETVSMEAGSAGLASALAVVVGVGGSPLSFPIGTTSFISASQNSNAIRSASAAISSMMRSLRRSVLSCWRCDAIVCRPWPVMRTLVSFWATYW